MELFLFIVAIMYVIGLFAGLLILSIHTVISIDFWPDNGELDSYAKREKAGIVFWWKWIWIYPILGILQVIKLVRKFRSSK